MVLRPPPYWECFASDWLAKEQFRLATMQERGLLFSMLNQIWACDTLPEDPSSLARLLGIGETEVGDALTSQVLSFFEATNDGRLVCPELRDQKAGMLERRRERAVSGRKGGLGRSSAKAQLGTVAKATPEMKRDETRRKEAKRAFREEQPLSPEQQAWAEEYAQH